MLLKSLEFFYFPSYGSFCTFTDCEKNFVIRLRDITFFYICDMKEDFPTCVTSNEAKSLIISIKFYFTSFFFHFANYL